MRTNADLARLILLEAGLVRAQVEAAELDARRRAEQVEADARAQREQADRQRRAAEERRQRNRRIRSAAGGLAVFAVPVWVLTPVIGSIISIFSDNVTRVVFLSGDTGDTAGSGPFTLYGLLWKLLLGGILCLAGLGLLFPYPPDAEVISTPGMAGFGAGSLLLVVQAFGGSGSAASWWWPALFAVLGHLGYGLYLHVRAVEAAR